MEESLINNGSKNFQVLLPFGASSQRKEKCHRVYEKVIGLWAEVTFQKGHKRTDWTLSSNSLGTYKARPKIASNSS